MEHPYGKQYGQEGNPRAYMTMRDYRNLELQNQQPVERNPSEYMSMRDYRNLELQNQQPVGRNPNPNMSLREYRDKWMSAPVYHVPSTCPPPPQYDYPEPPFHASTPQSPQSQQPPPLSPIEQAVLNLSKMIGTIQEEQKVLSVQTKQQIEALESSANRNLSNMHAEISRLFNQFVHQEEENLEEESQEEECLTEPILGEQVQLQPQEELKVELVKAPPEELQDTPQSGDTFWPRKQEEQTSALISEEESQEEESLTETVLVEQTQLQPQEELEVESLEAPEELQDAPVNFWPWTKEKEITALLTEKSSEHEGTQEPIIQPNPQAIPIDLDTIATAQATKNPLPTAPSTDQVYILPASQSQHKTPAAPKAKSNPLHVVQNFKELVASVHALATTSKTMATAYIAWHSGWFGCGFGFGTPGPRHF